MVDFHDRIRTGVVLEALRRHRKIQQKDLVNVTGLNVTALSRLENGHRVLMFTEAIDLCDFYHFNIDCFGPLKDQVKLPQHHSTEYLKSEREEQVAKIMAYLKNIGVPDASQ